MPGFGIFTSLAQKSGLGFIKHPQPMTAIKVMKFKGRKKKDLTNQTNDWLDLEVTIYLVI
jgi:hypothetical protein